MLTAWGNLLTGGLSFTGDCEEWACVSRGEKIKVISYIVVFIQRRPNIMVTSSGREPGGGERATGGTRVGETGVRDRETGGRERDTERGDRMRVKGKRGFLASSRMGIKYPTVSIICKTLCKKFLYFISVKS